MEKLANETNDIKLVQQIEKWPCIYDARSAENAGKEKAWEEISILMGATVSECKDKWETIRISYLQSLKTQLTPHYLASYLTFLIPFMETQQPSKHLRSKLIASPCKKTARTRSPKLDFDDDEISEDSESETSSDEDLISETSSTFNEALKLTIAQRRAKKRHYDSLSKLARKEYIASERKAQLERILLPDAPPRKRPSKYPSPERTPCQFAPNVALTDVARLGKVDKGTLSQTRRLSYPQNKEEIDGETTQSSDIEIDFVSALGAHQPQPLTQTGLDLDFDMSGDAAIEFEVSSGDSELKAVNVHRLQASTPPPGTSGHAAIGTTTMAEEKPQSSSRRDNSPPSEDIPPNEDTQLFKPIEDIKSFKDSTLQRQAAVVTKTEVLKRPSRVREALKQRRSCRARKLPPHYEDYKFAKSPKKSKPEAGNVPHVSIAKSSKKSNPKAVNVPHVSIAKSSKKSNPKAVNVPHVSIAKSSKKSNPKAVNVPHVSIAKSSKKSNPKAVNVPHVSIAKSSKKSNRKAVNVPHILTSTPKKSEHTATEFLVVPEESEVQAVNLHLPQDSTPTPNTSGSGHVVMEYELPVGETELQAVTFNLLEPQLQPLSQPQLQALTVTILEPPQPQPGTSGTRPAEINDATFNDSVLVFLNGNDSDSDSDSNNDSDDDLCADDDINDFSGGIAIPLLTARSVNDNPTDNTGLNEDLVRILQVEDRASDLFVREIAQTGDYDFDWTSDRRAFTGTREVFTGSPGPTFHVSDDMTVVDIFHKMFDHNFLDLLVTETNEYAAQKLQLLKDDPTSPKQSRLWKWTPTDRDEMVAFLAFILLQGLYPKVKEESYFTYDGFGTTPYFGRIMTYNRYCLLKVFLHFVNNRTTTDQTKLNKIRPVIDYFNDKFSCLYTPGREISIDESLLKWAGHLSFAQKIATKAARVGVKTYELCESSTGYLWSFRVYTGKDGPDRTRPTGPDDGDDHRADQPDRSRQSDGEDRQTERPPVTNLDSGEFRPGNAIAKIVYDLVGPLLHRGHTLIMDNFYNSPLLARCLKKSKTDVFGTLRVTREFVPESLKSMTKSDLRSGEVVASYCSDVALMLWRDASLVGMISTYHPLQVGTSDKHNRLAYKPAIVLDYNKYMGGVDRKDQFLAGQPLERTRNKIWYKKLFRRLFNVAVFNCFVIYTSNARNKVNHRTFRTMLAEALLKQYRQIDLKTEARLLRPKTTTVTRTLSQQAGGRTYVEGNHFPVHTGSKFTTCWICSRDYNQKTRTVYKCEECNINLCVLSCFKKFHKHKPLP